jgi:hypothetical protein
MARNIRNNDKNRNKLAVLRTLIRIRIRIHRINMFFGLLDPDPDQLVRGMDPAPDPAPDLNKKKI